MQHYHIVIIGTGLTQNPHIRKLQYKYDILLLDETIDATLHYRNHIKTKDGYVLVLLKNKKNIQVTTDHFINLHSDNERKIELKQAIEEYLWSIIPNQKICYNGI